jgi:hypothetical protein
MLPAARPHAPRAALPIPPRAALPVKSVFQPELPPRRGRRRGLRGAPTTATLSVMAIRRRRAAERAPSADAGPLCKPSSSIFCNSRFSAWAFRRTGGAAAMPRTLRAPHPLPSWQSVVGAPLSAPPARIPAPLQKACTIFRCVQFGTHKRPYVGVSQGTVLGFGDGFGAILWQTVAKS